MEEKEFEAGYDDAKWIFGHVNDAQKTKYASIARSVLESDDNRNKEYAKGTLKYITEQGF